MTIQTISLADLAALRAQVRTRATREPHTRAPGLTARFLLAADAMEDGTAAPLAASIAAWCIGEREEGRTTGSGATPEASISAGVYLLRKANKLQGFKIEVVNGRAYLIKE